MSLTIALRSALASMQAIQTSFQVTSNNVANANNEGYSRKVTYQSTLVVDGLASGVRIESIKRVVDQNLIRQLREQVSVVANLAVQDGYYSRMQQLFGTLADDSSLSHSISELGTAIDAPSSCDIRALTWELCSNWEPASWYWLAPRSVSARCGGKL